MIGSLGEKEFESEGLGQHQTDLRIAPSRSRRVLKEYHDALEGGKREESEERTEKEGVRGKEIYFDSVGISAFLSYSANLLNMGISG